MGSDTHGMTANDITRKILLTLPDRVPCRVWRRNVGAGYPSGPVHQAMRLLESNRASEALALLRRTRVVVFGLPGEADIDGILQGGRRLAVEVKAGADRVRPEQAGYQRMLELYGGLYVIAHTPEGCVDEIVSRLAQADLDCCVREQARAKGLMDAGHQDRRGLERAGEDWLMEEAVLRSDK